MNDKGHFYTSLTKSTVCIVGCIVLMFTGHLLAFGTAFLLAEVLGIIEEVADKR